MANLGRSLGTAGRANLARGYRIDLPKNLSHAKDRTPLCLPQVHWNPAARDLVHSLHSPESFPRQGQVLRAEDNAS